MSKRGNKHFENTFRKTALITNICELKKALEVKKVPESRVITECTNLLFADSVLWNVAEGFT